MDHQNNILRCPLGNMVIHCAAPPLTQTQTHTDLLSSPSHFLSLCLSVSLCIPQQARQMAAPWPAVPGKACELKVIPSRFEELPAPSLCSRGGPRPTCLPGSRTSGWGFVEWWARCRQPPRPAPCRKEKASSVEFFSYQMNKWVGLCLLVCVFACVRQCVCMCWEVRGIAMIALIDGMGWKMWGPLAYTWWWSFSTPRFLQLVSLWHSFFIFHHF